MAKYKAVLFDLDGTLLNTIDDLADAMNASLAACGLPTHTVAECKYFVGDGVRNFALRLLAPDVRDEATLAKVIALYRDAYSRNWDNKTRPYEGIPELLDALAARGLAMIVYSNKPDEFTNLTVKKLLARWRFAAIVGAGAMAQQARSRRGARHRRPPGPDARRHDLRRRYGHRHAHRGGSRNVSGGGPLGIPHRRGVCSKTGRRP